MSIAALDWVLKHSEATLGSRLVLIALADTAHDDGSKTFPSVETIASKARMSRRAAQAGLRKLEEEGHIVATGRTRNGTNVYTIVGLGGEDSSRGGEATARGGEATAGTSGEASTPEPLTTTQPSGKNSLEPIGFDEWLEHHCLVTGQHVPGSATKARRELARKFGELAGEGRSLEDMKLASVGAQADKWLRENGKVFPRNVLVSERIDELIEKGRRAKRAGPPTGEERKRFERQGPRREI
jgi:hypothetical protein